MIVLEMVSVHKKESVMTQMELVYAKKAMKESYVKVISPVIL